VDVNFRHKINGWTALHWAARRGHKTVVEVLLKYGADPQLVDAQGRSPADVASDPTIIDLLGGRNQDEKSTEPLPVTSQDAFIPNYLRHPPFIHAQKTNPKYEVNSMPSRDNTDNTPERSNISTKLIYAGAGVIVLAGAIFFVRSRLRIQ